MARGNGRSAVSLLWAAALWAGACIGDPPAATLTERQRQSLQRHLVDEPPAGMVPLDADFGGKLRLRGYTLSPKREQHEPGQRVKLTLVWEPRAAVTGGWQVFTHLLDPGGRIVANLDRSGPLRAMKGVTGVPLPPAKWPAGKLVRDPVSFDVPKGAAAKLRVVAGLFRGRERLAVTGAAADSPHRRVTITRLPIAGSSAAAVKQLRVPHRPADATVTIDGELGEPAWARAADTGRFVHAGTGERAANLPVGGRAKLLWDAEFLYVGFEVDDRTVRGGFPADAVDPHLWEKDTVEIMVDPDGDGDNKDYYEIQISPQNLVFDSQFDSYNRPRGGPSGPFGHQQWRAQLDSAVRIHGTLDDDSDRDRGYTVEARLPWRSFTKARRAPPRAGDQWRMNFYAMQNNGGAAWSPILGQGNFHRASRFGRVQWVD
jgi:hypothetical protein